MLKKLDRYIIKQYLSTFFFLALVASMLAGVVDFSDHVDDFLKSKAPIKEIVFHYYLNYFPYINGLLWPIYSLITVIFFTSRMAYNSEIISILNAGTSFWRLLYPYIVAASIVAGINLLMNTVLIPQGNKKKTEFENTYFYKNNDKGKTRNVHLFTSPNSKIYIKRYIKRDSSAQDVMIEGFKDGQVTSILFADKIKCLPEEGKWRLKNYYIRTFKGLREEIVEGTELDTVINLLPEDFIAFDNAQDAMTSRELTTHINRQRSRGAGGTASYEIEMHRRYAQPFTIFILTLIGVSLASRKIRGGIGLHLALGLGIGSLYIFMFQFSKTFSINGSLPPSLGVWIPSIVFSFVALYLISKAQK